MNTIVDRIVESTRARVAISKDRFPLTDLLTAASEADPPRGFERSVRSPGLSVIAEIKRRSPSAGELAPEADPARIGRDYESAGASALSVLTEGEHFGGSLDDLSAARRACKLPVLRKDFMIDGYQLVEARAYAADAVLLIVSILDDHELRALYDEACSLGLDVLVEVHDERELERASALGASLIGINQRDLKTFQVDTLLAARLRAVIPSDVAVVAESGVSSPDQVKALADSGIDAVLIGGHLMASGSPGPALEHLMRGMNG